MARPDDREMFRKHSDDLVALATVLVGPSAAADVVSGAVSRSISSPQWDSVENRHAYWVRAVYNEARSSYRSSMRRLAREDLVARRNSATMPEPEIRPEITRAVSALSMRQRTVIYLTYWRDMTVPEIAEFLAISDGSVRRHLARARRTLRRTLQ